MGKRPQQNKGKKKGGKRSRVQRDYDEGLDDDVVEQHIGRPRAAEHAEEGRGLHRDVGEVKRPSSTSNRKRACKPPPEKPKGLTKAQRRARRRRELRGL